jgi:phage terminase small subunit
MKPEYQLFVANYLKTKNATAAARAAGYSEKSAHTQGSRLLQRIDIAAAIRAHDAKSEKKKEQAVAKLELTATRVMEELATIALFDPATMYGEDGKLLPVAQMPESTRRAIAGIEEKLDGTKLRISSKLGSIELISKIIGMIKQQDVFQPVQIIIGAAPARPIERVDNSKILPEWE